MRVVKKPEERRAEMVSAASKLFVAQGFVKTSVSEIVSAVDVAKGLFYYYFTTKDEMVKAVVEGLCSYLGAEADKIAGGEGTAREKFAQMMKHEAWNRCFTEPMLHDLCMPQHAALYSDMCDRVVTHVRPAVERIMEQALAERGVGSDYVSRMAGMAMYGALMMARRGEMDLEGVGEMFAELTGLEDAQPGEEGRSA